MKTSILEILNWKTLANYFIHKLILTQLIFLFFPPKTVYVKLFKYIISITRKKKLNSWNYKNIIND